MSRFPRWAMNVGAPQARPLADGTAKVSRRVRAVWLAALCLGGFASRLAAEPAPGLNYLGINIGTVTDWEGNLIFADAMKQARTFAQPNSSGGTALPAASLDAHGWPLVASEIVVWAGLNRDNSGTYALSFASDAAVTPAFGWASGSLTGVVYDPAAKTTTATLVLTASSNTALLLKFSGAVRNVKLMRPIAPGSATSHAVTETFSRPFLAALAPFHALRFMDFMSTYGNPQVAWADRVQPDETTSVARAGYSWIGKGGAWEDVIRLANETRKDAWICVPLKASDDFIHQLARLFRDGNAFTGGTGLDPAVKLYVEYDNEVWNTAGSFDGNPNHALAVAEQAAGDPYAYAYDGSTNDWAWAWRRVGRRAADISLIFRQEFGDARMMTQVRPVLCWQQGYTGGPGYTALTYVEDAYLPKFAPGRTLPYLFYAGGGSAYYNPDNSSDALTLANFWTSQTMDPAAWEPALKGEADLCAAFGLKRVAYEGGPSLDNTGHSETVKAQAWADARMGTSMTDHHDHWSAYGGDLLMYYTLRPNDYQWGFMRSIDDLTLPKYTATAALGTAARAATTCGRAVPATVNGNSYDLKNWSADTTWMGTAVQLSTGHWTSYTVRVAQAGPYDVTAAYTGGGGGQLALLIDGVPALAQAATGSGALTATVTLQPGLHSVRTRAAGATVTVASVKVAVSASVIAPYNAVVQITVSP